MIEIAIVWMLVGLATSFKLRADYPNIKWDGRIMLAHIIAGPITMPVSYAVGYMFKKLEESQGQ